MKNKFLISLVTVLFFSGSLITIEGIASQEGEAIQNGAEYDSNGAVGFYGKYVFPSETPDEETPHPGIVKPEPKPKPGITLPQTGEMATFSSSAGGLLVVMAASIIYIARKKRVEEEN